MYLDNVQFFVYCSGKSGSKTLSNSLQKNFGNTKVLHVHSSIHFQKGHPKYGDIKQLIINNSKKFDKIYVIDSYREPFERSIASFFQNIDTHCPNWKTMNTEDIINFFNENKLYLLDLYHSYHESWGYFDVSTDVEFNFDKGFIKRQYENIIFIKTRLKESYRWNEIFSEILETPILFNYENNGNQKSYSEIYKDFKQKYILPTDTKKELLEIINSNTLDKNSKFGKTYLEMKKFMTTEEIENYLNKWLH